VPGAVGPGHRERLQQGPEEEPLVYRAHPGLLVAQLLDELGPGVGRRRVPVTEHARQTGEGVGVGGKSVHLLLVDQLQAVLHRPQEAVRGVEGLGVAGGDVAGVGQLGQGGECGTGADARVLASVHELEELDRELDVADAASAPLDLSLGEAPAGELVLGPGLHGPHLPQLVGAEGARPQSFGGGGLEGGAEVGAPGRRSGLQQGLELPGLGPVLPVGPVGLQGPHEGPVASLGTQVGVDAEAGAGDLHHGAGLTLGRQRVLGHEQHVDVAGVVQLLAAELPHADYRQPHCLAQAARRVEHVVGHGGQGPPDGAQVVEAQQVAGGDAQELEALPPAQELPVALLQRGATVEVGQDVEGRRLAEAQLGEGPAGRRDCGKGLTQPVVVLDRGSQVGVSLGQPLEGERGRRRRRRLLDELGQQGTGHVSSVA